MKSWTLDLLREGSEAPFQIHSSRRATGKLATFVRSSKVKCVSKVLGQMWALLALRKCPRTFETHFKLFNSMHAIIRLTPFCRLVNFASWILSHTCQDAMYLCQLATV